MITSLNLYKLLSFYCYISWSYLPSTFGIDNMQLGSVSCIAQSIDSHILLFVLNTIIIIAKFHHTCHSQNAAPQQLAARSCVARCAAASQLTLNSAFYSCTEFNSAFYSCTSVSSCTVFSQLTLRPLQHHCCIIFSIDAHSALSNSTLRPTALSAFYSFPAAVLHCHLKNWIHLLWCILVSGSPKLKIYVCDI